MGRYQPAQAELAHTPTGLGRSLERLIGDIIGGPVLAHGSELVIEGKVFLGHGCGSRFAKCCQRASASSRQPLRPTMWAAGATVAATVWRVLHARFTSLWAHCNTPFR